MDKLTDDEEITKLLDVKDIEFIEASELIENNENDRNCENTKLLSEKNDLHHSDAKSNGYTVACTERRSDEPTELSFEKGEKNVI